ncbi:hypothetical protein J2W91_004611 [Paenibacillus amylolyticus]|uniref:Uncharacterized protein n=1 Tax=Paenibacillus amylolyticus TaxID=1451 RepID=A0AAP5H4B2_PAEAM|nr:hypothetical protein [Paenibacillus amylolyticus]MDR6726105.1 hypothetical protein [Paenibacillus amylolyticus]
MRTQKSKVFAALTVCHGIYKKVVFVLNGQPVKIHFLTMDEYREMVDSLAPVRTHEWAGMLKKVDERKAIYYCIWTVRVKDYHLITNKIQELIDAVTTNYLTSFELDIPSIEVRMYQEVH